MEEKKSVEAYNHGLLAHSDIISRSWTEIFNTEFNAFAKRPDLDLAPADLRDAMSAIDAKVYPGINDGVYRCGFAGSQVAERKTLPQPQGLSLSISHFTVHFAGGL